MVRAMGYKTVVDERTLIIWKAKQAPVSDFRRTTFRLPIGGDWIARGQEPLGASRVGKLIITSGIAGIDRKTGLLPEDPARQFELAYENLRFVLESMGVAGPQEIAHLTVFIPDPKFRNLINRGWMALYPDGDRPARKTNQVPLPEGMYVQLQAIAVPGEKRTQLEIPGLAHRDPLPMGVKAGPFVFSSVISPQDPKTGQNATGGALAQIKQGFENVRLLMEQAGGTVDDVNHLWVFMKNFDHQPAMVDEWVRVYPNEGERPARKTVQYELGVNTEIQIQATGYIGARRANFETPGHTHHDPIPMAARTGGLLQSSGISGIDPATGKVPGDLDSQIKFGMMHVRNLMTESGGTLDDIVSITILVRDLSQAATVSERLVELFPDPAKQPALKFINYRMPGSSHIQYHVTALIGE
jgi:2-iminobutanoate/2-iminopropanoate deaminase